MEVVAEIITIGDELLIGQVVDTNSAWMGQELNKAGIRVKQITSVSDEPEHIISALKDAESRADIILITGGLGPTKDDLTKLTLCSYFDSELVFDEQAYKHVERLFKMRGKEVTEVNRKQAELPDNCKPIYNRVGTASGMLFEKGNKIIISMPGVPYEMKPMMSEQIIPLLTEKFNVPYIFHRTILTQGIGESMLAEMIADWEDNLPSDLKLAYLPSAGAVKLRLSAYGGEEKTAEQVNHEINKVLPLIQEYVFGFDDDTIQKVVGDLLKERKQTIATAESCTGGYLAHCITSVPGSSSYYIGSVIAYSNEVKIKELNVSPEMLHGKGAVSEETIIEMVNHCRVKFRTDYALATSGIAGPDGGTADKPVGTVWIGVATPHHTIAKKFLLGNDRMRIIEVASATALNMLRKELSPQK